jgi:hypothetical protein
LSINDTPTQAGIQTAANLHLKHGLVRYKYPPDKQPEAIRLVIEQMEAMAPYYVAQGASA